MSGFPSQARIVIVGGGVGGCSIAYHLVKLGWKDVVLIERGELTSGSTWHSAGLIGQLRSTIQLTRMARYSIDLYRRLKDETGHDPGWREVGSIRLATTQERMEEFQRMIGLAQSFDIPLDWIDLQEAHELFPLMVMDDVLGALYSPHDGFVDPSGLTMAFAAGARSGGAKLFTDTEVKDICVSGGRVREVITNRGNIKTEIVVNAAGMWAGEVARMVGVSLPVVPMAHLYVITRPVEGVGRDYPLLRDPDASIYFREEVGGLIAGGYEKEPFPWGLDGIPQGFNNQLLPPDWDRFMPLMEAIIHRVPAMETAEIQTLLNGPEGFTPDGEFLLGPTEVGGFWVAAAFCAHGLAGAGAVGKAMAEWIATGHPEWDMWHLDLRRFGSNYASQAYSVARAVETYSKYYDIRYPNEERQSARKLRLSPIYHQLEALGAVFGQKAGWERPNWFAPHEEKAEHGYEPKGWARHHWSPAIGIEHLAVRERAGLFDLTSFSKIDVKGPAALSFLQWLCANDIDKPVNSVTYTAMLNARGGIEGDVTVTRLGQDHFRIITGTALRKHNLMWLRMHAPDDGSVHIEDVTSAYACVGIWGPRSRDILKRVTRHDISSQSFPYMTARKITIGYVPVTALRVTYVGELGWEFYCPMEYGERLWATLWDAGHQDDLVAGGYRAVDTLRLEKGYRLWGADITGDDTPLEAGLGFAVAVDKGDFLGRAALLGQQKRGVDRYLCCLTLSDKTAVAIGSEPIRPRGKEQIVGRVTSGGYGYAVGKSIAFGYLSKEYADIGTELDVEILDERIPVIVQRESLWDPEGRRIHS
jgi:glycine cleavage system T protein